MEEVGQFAVRGGILDVFSFGSPEPFRVEFWGDEITSLRTFDILDQRSVRKLETAHILPVDFRSTDEGTSVNRSLLELLPPTPSSSTGTRRTGPRSWKGPGPTPRTSGTNSLSTGQSPEPVESLFLPPDEAGLSP